MQSSYKCPKLPSSISWMPSATSLIVFAPLSVPCARLKEMVGVSRRAARPDSASMLKEIASARRRQCYIPRPRRKRPGPKWPLVARGPPRPGGHVTGVSSEIAGRRIKEQNTEEANVLDLEALSPSPGVPREASRTAIDMVHVHCPDLDSKWDSGSHPVP
jgi:hypothetical protein